MAETSGRGGDVLGSHAFPIPRLPSAGTDPEDLANLWSKFSKDHFATIFQDEYDLVLALVTDVRRRFNDFHTLFVVQPGRAFRMKHVVYFAGSPKPFKVEGPYAVGQ